MEDKTVGVLYKHYKGNTYIVVGEGKHTETGEELVIYTSSTLNGPFWCRPKEMFHGYTEDGVKRFTQIGD